MSVAQTYKENSSQRDACAGSATLCTRGVPRALHSRATLATPSARIIRTFSGIRYNGRLRDTSPGVGVGSEGVR